mgnify:CR=1 FL=1
MNIVFVMVITALIGTGNERINEMEFQSPYECENEIVNEIIKGNITLEFTDVSCVPLEVPE